MNKNPASLDSATPSDWNSARQKLAEKESDQYVDPYDQPPLPDVLDLVDAPPHYNTGNIECIDAIQESMSPDAFKGYCKGNALKYIWRMSYKGKPVEDIRKAIWYLERLIDSELAYPTKVHK